MKKYEFTGETKRIALEDRIVTLHRIRAIKDFGIIKVGDIGGWIEKEENLSHKNNAWVGGNARVGGNAWVGDSAYVRGNAYVSGNVYVRGNACVSDNAYVRGNAYVGGNAWVRGNACVGGKAWVGGNARVCSNAEILSVSHILTIGAIGSRNDFTTFYRDKDNQISVSCGCFSGKIEEFLEAVTRTHRDSKHAQVYRAAVEVAKLQIELN